MGNSAEIDALKKKILSVRVGSTRKHYKISIGEICDVLMSLLEQIELLGQSSSTLNTVAPTETFETIIEENDSITPETNTDMPMENN